MEHLYPFTLDVKESASETGQQVLSGANDHVVRKAKIILMYLAKAVGLFALARRMTRRHLRILCYHGISMHDEHDWRPGLFMRQETFRQRMKLLRRGNYPVIRLDEAVSGLRDGSLPPSAVVITFDDGFHGVLTKGVPAFQEFGVPVTLYVTTYYVLKGSPIFRLAMQYGAWKAQRLGEKAPSEADLWAEIERAEKLPSEGQRDEVARNYLAKLGLDWDELSGARALSLVTPDELRELFHSGVDIQLHTHRHRLPVDERAATKELLDNRRVLEAIVRRPLVHFCYPSGAWSKEHLPVLRAANVKSATTCDDGLNPPSSDPLTLHRFIDSETKSPIEFEAEISGFKDLLQRLLRRRWSSHSAPSVATD